MFSKMTKYCIFPVLILILATSFIACGGVPPAQQPATEAAPVAQTAKNGWMVVEKPDDGFTVSVPDTWKENPRAKEGGFLTYFVDPVKPPEGSTRTPGSFSVAKKQLPQTATMDELQSSSLKSFSGSTSIKLTAHRRLTLPVGDTLQFDYQRDFTREGGQVETMLFKQYFVIKGTDVWVFTFETIPALNDKYGPIYEDIAGSFKFTR